MMHFINNYFIHFGKSMSHVSKCDTFFLLVSPFISIVLLFVLVYGMEYPVPKPIIGLSIAMWTLFFAVYAFKVYLYVNNEE